MEANGAGRFAACRACFAPDVARDWRSTFQIAHMQREVTMAEAKQQNISVEPSHRFNLLEVNWEDVNEPGAYVEKGTGDLFRIPKEALVAGGSPIVMKESSGSSRLLQISRDPFVTTLEARRRCAQHNVAPNF